MFGNCAVLGYYTTGSGKKLPLLVAFLYHYYFCNNPEERSSQLLCGGSLESRILCLLKQGLVIV